jgi:uncharacterized phage protein (TIGR01671 family)
LLQRGGRGAGIMDNIKFRAWHIERKIMLTVYNLAFSDEFNEPLAYRSVQVRLDGSWKWLEEDEYILMMFTGLHDKNGVEVFEGDIIHIWSVFFKKDMPKAIVYWNEKKACFDIKEPNGLYHRWLAKGHHRGWFIEIIGNIHSENDSLK